MSTTKILWGQIALVCLIVLVTMWAATQLAHQRPCRGRAADNAISGSPSFGHQPDQAAGAAHSQSDWPPLDRRPACKTSTTPAPLDARRVPSVGPPRLFRIRAGLHGRLWP